MQKKVVKNSRDIKKERERKTEIRLRSSEINVKTSNEKQKKGKTEKKPYSNWCQIIGNWVDSVVICQTFIIQPSD